MRSVAPLLLFVLTAGVVPQPGPVDPHIQHVRYDPEQVTDLQGALGWQIMIEFAPDERIENVSIGDSLSWQVTPNKRARGLFLKPLRRDGRTNMTVVTSQRRYAFDLSMGPRRVGSPWVLQFDYPPPPVMLTRERAPAPAPILNFAYTRLGDPSVMPSRVWDDGRQTYFEFSTSTAIPAIFAAGPGKNEESLVNVATRGRVQVVQQLGQQFILRSGAHFATVTRAREERR